MSDPPTIIPRLRSYFEDCGCPSLLEAADEIERLRAALREIRDHCEPWPARLAGDALPSEA